MRRMISVFLVISLMGIGVPTVFRTIHRRFAGVNAGVTLDGRKMEYYYGREVRTVIEQMALKVQRPPQNAGIHKETGDIIPEESGVYVDIDQTAFDVLGAPRNSEIAMTTIEVIPQLRKEHLEKLIDQLGDFSTPLMGSPGRVGNIRLSLAAINNTLLMPGEQFSFNEIVGERTPERGYRNAPIILGEAVVPGVGGGICQTSSTLYNAVNRADLEIVERSIHSLPPSYIQHGRDAAVAWPYTDFKFRNNKETPVIVKGEIQGWRVRVWILGQEDN